MADLKVFSPTGQMVGLNKFDTTDRAIAEHNLIACSESKANNSVAVTIEENGFAILVDNRSLRIEPR